jgi:hypothetical protein
MLIYTDNSALKKLSPSLENIKSVHDVNAVLKAQGFLQGSKNDKFTPDIDELSKAIYFLIQRSLQKEKALMCELLKLTPQTATGKKILAIFYPLNEEAIITSIEKKYNNIQFQESLYLLGCYCDHMISSCKA